MERGQPGTGGQELPRSPAGAKSAARTGHRGAGLRRQFRAAAAPSQRGFAPGRALQTARLLRCDRAGPLRGDRHHALCRHSRQSRLGSRCAIRPIVAPAKRTRSMPTALSLMREMSGGRSGGRARRAERATLDMLRHLDLTLPDTPDATDAEDGDEDDGESPSGMRTTRRTKAAPNRRPATCART